MAAEKTRLLLIDSYDSFTHNLASLCHRSIPNCDIYIIKNDVYTIDELLPYLCYFSAIIIGPGPGSPDNWRDIGVVKDLWKVQEKYVLPIFGVCLGLQSMAIEFGAELKRLHVVKHGQVSHIYHEGIDLFHGVGPVRAVRYHSLHTKLPEGGVIQELAWADDGEENGRITMAVKHQIRPFWSIQYHPESVCTKGGGAEVINNFWRLAQTWVKENKRIVHPWDGKVSKMTGNSWPNISPPMRMRTPSPPRLKLTNITLDLPTLSVIVVCELFNALDETSPFILLDSAARPGRFSIVASLLPNSLQITYFVGDPSVTLKKGELKVRESLGNNDIWSWLATFMRAHKAQGCEEIPFWGGLVGQMSYEIGINSLQISPRKDGKNSKKHPDLNFFFVERSVVLDSVTGKVYIQSLIPNDDAWVAQTKNQLIAASHQVPIAVVKKGSLPPLITLPEKDRYISRISQAKEHLFAGDSYELCLTAHTHVSIPECSEKTLSSWERYNLLRLNNPAPHSAYLRLHPTILLSSSPERFLSFSRPPGSICQLRPIKGTVRKGTNITRPIAERLLVGSTKEVAENLMIVDLIRHDLHGVVGDDVRVNQFCGVEEYETVWQLVSVVEGKFASDTSASLDPDSEVGWDVLKKSLPPGSMTGAPKKRSVEILQTLEDHDRGIYSGVFGYWCVGGSGDWSVTIRSCFKYDENLPSGISPGSQGLTENWTIGAGGAITALSDPDAEWEEMVVKLQSVLRAFGAVD